MGATIEQWMRDAAHEYLTATNQDSEGELAAIIASHAPSEAAAQPTPAYLSSDESALVISSACAGDSPKGDRQAEIEHNDH